MRAFLYQTIENTIAGLKDEKGQPLFPTVDLWNEQVDFAEQEEPYDTPAVFIEFMSIPWKSMGGGVQMADTVVRLHVVTTWKGSSRQGSPTREESMTRFTLLERLTDALTGIKNSDGRHHVDMVRRRQSETNHNHEELVEDIEDMDMHLTDAPAKRA